jgi:hypothetical protein
MFEVFRRRVVNEGAGSAEYGVSEASKRAAIRGARTRSNDQTEDTKAPGAKRTAPNNGANAAPAGIPDPAFAMIDAHKARTKEWCRFYNKLDEAEFEAGKTHGKRPLPMIAWRPMIAEYGSTSAARSY